MSDNRPAAPNDPSWGAFGRFVGQVGVPAALAFYILFSLAPAIQHGIAIADHVDAELQFLAARGCAPLPLAAAPAPLSDQDGRR